MVEFADRIPTLRVAVELKLRRFSNTSKKWGINDLRDIDALSRAVPYCDVVVADKEMAGFATQARIHEDYGTRIISRLSELPAELPSLIQRSADLGGDASGWDSLGPGEGFNVDEPTRFAG